MLTTFTAIVNFVYFRMCYDRRMTVNIAVWFLVPFVLCNFIDGTVGLAADLPPKEEPAAKKSFCVSERVYRMNGYDCSNMNLRDVPQNLKTGVEVRQLYQPVFSVFSYK